MSEAPFRRMFLALWPTRALQDELVRLTGPSLPSELNVARPYELHVTLVFLGEVEAERAAELDRRLAPLVAEFARPELRVRGTGAFPHRGRERILWAAVEEVGSARLGELQARIAAACSELGFAREERPWSPHITLARVRRERRPPPIPERFFELDFSLSWTPPGVSRVVSRPGAGEAERYVVAATQTFATA